MYIFLKTFLANMDKHARNSTECQKDSFSHDATF